MLAMIIGSVLGISILSLGTVVIYNTAKNETISTSNTFLVLDIDENDEFYYLYD